MSDPLAHLYPPPPPAWVAPALTYVPARLVAIDEDDESWYDVVECKVHVVQNALSIDVLDVLGEQGDPDPNLAAYYIEGADAGCAIEVKPEWVGKHIYLEVAPSLITGLADELVRICDTYGATPA